MDNLPAPFPTRLSDRITYPEGAIIPWYAANTKLELKFAKKNLPEGWELAHGSKVTLKPRMPKSWPHFMNGGKFPIYILYLRKI